MTDKTVLVTGACGEIGQALVQALAQRGGGYGLTDDPLGLVLGTAQKRVQVPPA